MDYEQKYKEALERMKSWARGEHPEYFTEAQKAAEFVFPELKESEDERMRKELLDYLHTRQVIEGLTDTKVKMDWITWLEKQKAKEDLDRMAPIYEDKESFESALEKAWELYNNSGARTVDSCEDNYVECAYAKGFREGFLFGLKRHESILPNVKEEQKPADKVNPKFKVGDVMRTLQEADDNITSGLPVVVYIGDQYYHCTNELIAIKDQEDYEYPPMNRIQKPTDKVESKFKIGDWVVVGENIIGELLSIPENGCYAFYNTDNGKNVFSDYPLHLWTIEDAKEGDVLVASDETLFIFAGTKDNAAYYHYSLCKNGSQEISDGKHAWESANSCHPATKEQRSLFFAKMNEAGYHWDADRKELRKIENL